MISCLLLLMQLIAPDFAPRELFVAMCLKKTNKHGNDAACH